MKEGKCRGCGAPIIWIETSNGKLMPCDIKPVYYWQKEKAAGKVVTPSGDVLSCDFEGDMQTVTGRGYVSHFGTCPMAGQFRKK